MSELFLSVVIPVYNEQQRILGTLQQVTSYLAQQPYTWEVLVVDDGSTDATRSLVEQFARETGGVSLLALPHGGKGWALKGGMLKASGQYRFLSDADLSMPIEQLQRFLPPQLTGYDLAIGSRELPGSRRIGEPPARHLMGRVFNALVRLLAVPGIKDTQCGFKCLRGEVAQELFTLQRLHGFSYDVELLFLARQRGYRIVEVPIDWYYQPRSRVHPLRDTLQMTRDLLRIRWGHLRGKYRSLPTPAGERP
ncbi:MAG: dolichyl-phosphate beta-glucosyltransferase [Dehalococcoidia bacterium]